MASNGLPSASSFGSSSGLRSSRPRVAPPPRPTGPPNYPKPPLKREPPRGPGSAGARSPPSMGPSSPASSTMDTKIKTEEVELVDSKVFTLFSAPDTLASLNVMRFPGVPADRNTDITSWRPPLKMHRFEPVALGPDPEDEQLEPRWVRRGADGEEAPPPLSTGPQEEFDASRVDEKIARKRARMNNNKQFQPWRGGRATLDDDLMAAEEVQKRHQARKDASIASLPFLLADAGADEENQYEGHMEPALSGDQYMLFAFTSGGFNVYPVKNFYNFQPKTNIDESPEEAEARMKKRIKAEAARMSSFAKRESKDDPDSYRDIMSILQTAGVRGIKDERQLDMEAQRLARRGPAIVPIVPRRNRREDDDEAEDWDYEKDMSDDEGSDNGGADWDAEGTRNEGRERREQEMRRYRRTKVQAETEGRDVEEMIEREYRDEDEGKARRRAKVSKKEKRLKDVIDGRRMRKREGLDEDEDLDLDGDDERDPYAIDFDISSSSESEQEQVILSKEEEARRRKRELDNQKQRSADDPRLGLPMPGARAPATPEVREKVTLRIPVPKAVRGKGSDSELSDASRGSGRKRRRVDETVPNGAVPALVAASVPAPAVAAPVEEQPRPQSPAQPRPPSPAGTAVSTPGSTAPGFIRLKMTVGAPGAKRPGDRQMSDGEMSDGNGGRKRRKVDSDVEVNGANGTLKPGALTKAEVIAALLPTSLDNKKIATKDLISLLKTQIIRDKAGNMDRLKVLIKELCIHATDGVVLKPEYRK